MKRKIAILLSITLLIGSILLAFTGCGEDKAKETGNNGELNLFTWQEYVPPTVVEKFEKETGIKINYTYFSTNEEMLAKVEATNGGGYDLILLSDYIVPFTLSDNLLAELDYSKIPNAKNIDPDYQSKWYDKENKYFIPYWSYFHALVYDPSQTDLTFETYADIADPSLKGKVSVVDEKRTLIGLASKTLGYSLNETDPAKLEEVRQWLKKLRPNIMNFNADAPQDAVLNGSAAVAVCYIAQAIDAKLRDDSLQIVVPSDIKDFGIDGFVLSSKAPNVDNAYKFLNFMLDPEVTALATQWTHYQHANLYANQYLKKEIEEGTIGLAPEGHAATAEMSQNLGTEVEQIYEDIWVDFK